MTNNRHKRQLGIISPAQLQAPLVVIGAGGIGSWAVLALAKMGCPNISVIDFDIVEDHNVATQFYKEEQIGMPKVEALRDNVLLFTGIEVIPFQARWEQVFEMEEFQQHIKESIVISALDSLAERKKLFRFITEKGVHPYTYIDSRMGGELFRMFTVDWFVPDSVQRYASKLFSNTKIHREPCTERAISYNTFLSGAMIAHAVKQLLKDKSFVPEIYVDINNVSIIN
jgi:hypothetical protein